MQDNLYLSSEKQKTPEFYVVSAQKFVILFLGTAGLYMTYWFYKQWECYKRTHQSKHWPIMRALFSVFFVHSLFRILTERYQQKSGKKSGVLKTASILFIIVAAISFFSGNVSDTAEIKPYLILVNLFTTPLFCWFCYQAQWFANYICEDVDGKSNNTFSAANYMWIAFGITLWAAYIVYLLIPLLMGNNV